MKTKSYLEFVCEHMSRCQFSIYNPSDLHTNKHTLLFPLNFLIKLWKVYDSCTKSQIHEEKNKQTKWKQNVFGSYINDANEIMMQGKSQKISMAPLQRIPMEKVLPFSSWIEFIQSILLYLLFSKRYYYWISLTRKYLYFVHSTNEKIELDKRDITFTYELCITNISRK